ncbi:AAA family ATPase [bacterium 3DAC]|nr:MinD/ParA family protein [Dictyoglomota bacterium]UZN22984.1 AAA family ATPase [bacterium 3DAC]
MDQARVLKQLAESGLTTTEERNTRFITVTSGKGGVGKTNFALNLSIALSKFGKKVLLADADIGLANVNILLGTSHPLTIYDIIVKGIDWREVVYPFDENFFILPGCSGIEEVLNLTETQLQMLVKVLDNMSKMFDFVIVDTGAGITRSLIAFALASPELILITTPEPSALADAYATLKVLNQKGYDGKIWTVVNMVRDIAEGDKAFIALSTLVKRFFDRDIAHLVNIPDDPDVHAAVSLQKPILVYKPTSKFSTSVMTAARKLLGVYIPERKRVSFWDKIVKTLSRRW